MSTYYNVYLFLRKKGEKNSEELEYIGAYDKNGLPVNVIKLRNDEPSGYYFLDGIFI